jgi:hypothetical protein
MPLMILQNIKHAGWPVLVVCAAVSACSKTPATQEAFVDARVGSGSSNGSTCILGSMQEFLLAGTRGNPLPTPAADGTDGLAIDCTVSPSGGGFSLELSAITQDMSSITVSGHVDASGGTVTASFVNQMWGAFTSNQCTLTYTYPGATTPVPKGDTVSSGSIFGHVSCPNAVNNSGSGVGSGAESCDGEVDILFQNCAE